MIGTEEENERVLAPVERMMAKGDKRSPEEDAILNLLVHLVEQFEEKAYPIGQAAPSGNGCVPAGAEGAQAQRACRGSRIEGPCIRNTGRQAIDQQRTSEEARGVFPGLGGSLYLIPLLSAVQSYVILWAI
jgi:hypothetical protein